MEQNQQQQPENEQKQQAKGSEPVGEPDRKKKQRVVSSNYPKDKDGVEIVGRIDMYIRGITVAEFQSLNVRLSEALDSMREAGELSEKVNVQTMAKGKAADPIVDEIDAIHRRIHDMEDAVENGAMGYPEYAEQLQIIMSRMSLFIEANTFALKMTGHSKHPQEGEASSQTHFSPEQQSAD